MPTPPLQVSATPREELDRLRGKYKATDQQQLSARDELDRLRAKFGAPPKEAETSLGERAVNALRGSAFALGDIGGGIAQLANRYLPLPEGVKSSIEERQARYTEAKRKATEKPWGTAGYVGGQIVLGLAPVPGAGLRSLAGVAKTIAPGVAQTFLKPYETEVERFQQTGLSAGLGVAGAGIASGASKVVGAIGGKLRPGLGGAPPTGGGPGGPGVAAGAPGGFDPRFIQKLKAAPKSRKTGELLESAQRLNVQPTAGQVAGGLPKALEEQMRKLPGSRKAAEEAFRKSSESYHMALGKEIGVDLSDNPYIFKETIEDAKASLSKVYEEIWPQAEIVSGTLEGNKLKLASAGLVSPLGKAATATIPKKELRKLQNFQEGLISGLDDDGAIAGKDLQYIRTYIREAKQGATLHPVVRERLSTFGKQMDNLVESSLDRTNPELADQLRVTNKRWANAKILEKAVGDVEGFVSGQKLWNEINRRGGPRNVGDFGKLAEMGSRFYRALPDSGTADKTMANSILTGGAAVLGVGGVESLLKTSATVVGLPKIAAAAYYNTPAYQRALKLARGSGRLGAAGVATAPGVSDK